MAYRNMKSIYGHFFTHCWSPWIVRNKNNNFCLTLKPKPCGVDYELKTYCAEDLEEKPHKRNSVRLAIRKLTYAPPSRAPQPMVDAHRDFMMSPAPLHLECTLDKEVQMTKQFIRYFSWTQNIFFNVAL